MNIMIITYARFPEGDAESIRLHSLGKILRDLGHSVSYVGMGNSQYLEQEVFDGFNYISLRKKSNNLLEKVYLYLNYKKRLKKYIENELFKTNIDIILCADLLPHITSTIKYICKKNKIKLIYDCVEWYSPEQFRLGNLSLTMIFKNLENKYIINKNVNVIAISRYLENHFSNKGCNCTRVPVVLDIKNINFEKKVCSSKLNILYAGSPGKKDYFEEMLKGILLLNDNEIDKLEFTLAGIKYSDIESRFTKEQVERLKKCVLCLGRVDRKVVLEKLYEADFTVLLRSSTQRYAKAGFPTKVVESLATGTPVILNITSDLGEYIFNNRQGLIVKECSAQEFSKTLKYALQLGKDKIDEMKHKARICAEENFDYRNYLEQLNIFISDSK